MDTWDGEYGWRLHALTGRPDLLNYLHTGDFHWCDVWSLHEQKELSGVEGLWRCFRLFHQYLSWQLDLEDRDDSPDALHAELISWARFCLAHPETIDEEELRDQLSALAESGAISNAYFEFAYRGFLAALFDHLAETWTGGDVAEEVCIEETVSTPDAGWTLRIYIPEDRPGFRPAIGWDAFKRAIALRQHLLWSSSYERLMEQLDEMVDHRPAL